MRTQNLIFSAAGSASFYGVGRYFRLIDVTVSAVDVNIKRNGAVIYAAYGVGAGFWSEPENGFDEVEIVSAAAQTVTVAMTNGRGGYDKPASSLALTGGVYLAQSSTIVDLAPVTVNTSAVIIAAASGSRRQVRIKNDGTDAIYIGSSGVTTANGAAKIQPGQLWVEDAAAAANIYAISATAGQSVKIQEVR